MNEIKCPNCGEVFTVNESQYSELLSQVRTAEFDKEIHARIEQELALAEQKSQNAQQTLSAQKDQEISRLKHQIEQFETEKELVKKEVEKEYDKSIVDKDQTITELRNQISQFDSQQELAKKEAQNQQQLILAEKEQEIADLHHKISQFETERELVRQEVEKNYDKRIADQNQVIVELQSQIAQFETQQELAKKEAEQAASLQLQEKDKEVQQLKNQLTTLRLEHENQLQKTLSALEKERDEVKNQLVLQEKEAALAQTSLKERYEVELRQKDETIEFYKDFKAKQSTKMIGESLEQHCEYEFNKNRMAMFPRAEFGKDNDARTGSKGDYIYREVDENGVEILSIMFEMKNEGDETATKKKNEHFFKELDKDRREKGCEYAILVTLLEADSELYNSGIVDVSYAYEKMYVIRPQFFLPMITLLRNAALNSLQYKQELALVREQNIDITHFEEDLDAFKVAFAKNYQSASTNFGKAIDEIDKAIRRMEEIKKFLTTSENQLRLANNKLDDVSVKKLTRKNPTMKAKFEALKK